MPVFALKAEHTVVVLSDIDMDYNCRTFKIWLTRNLVRTVFLLVLGLDSVVNFFPVNLDVSRGVHSDPDLISLNTKHGYRDFIADH